MSLKCLQLVCVSVAHEQFVRSKDEGTFVYTILCVYAESAEMQRMTTTDILLFTLTKCFILFMCVNINIYSHA